MIAWLTVSLLLWPQDSRLPVPDAATQKEREVLIRGIFKAEYSKPTPADKLALSKTLLQQAIDTKEDPPARFVLLREARDLAAEAGDIETSFSAIGSLAEGFQVAPAAMKTAALATAVKAAKTPDDHRRMAVTFLKLVEEALAADDAETATQAAVSATAAAKRAKDVPLVNKAEAASKEAAELKARAQALAAAKEKLASAPEDPVANSTLGMFLCVMKGEWEAGLPHLAKGTEGRLKEMAGKDLGNPAGVPDQVALGDGWWDLAEKEKGKAREALRRRALHWYEQVAPRLSGLNKVKVNQRIMTAVPSWMASDLFGHWKLDEGTGAEASDASPNKRHGKIDGAVWAKGKIGGALSFDGERSRVNIDAGQVSPPWTAVMWVLRENSQNPTARLMDSSGSSGASLRLEQSGSAQRVGITQYAVVDHAFNFTAPAGEWTHLAWIGTQKDVALFANGAQVDVLNQPIPLVVDKLGSHGPHPLKGSLDDIRVYTRALTAKEVELLYQFGPKK